MAGREASAPAVDAVLVSHAHADHVNNFSFLHRDIPIYMGSTCRTILRAIQDRAPRDFEREVLDFLPRPSKRGAKAVSRHQNAPMVADFNFKDMDMVRTFFNIAKENGCKLVVKLKDCYYLKYLSQDPAL